MSAPVFLLCSTSVMCDTMMLALWVWSLIFWMEGLKANRPMKLCVSAILIAACGLTKYFGFALVPLVVAYSLMERRKAGFWLAWLVIPIAILFFYEWWTRRFYGTGALSDALSYSQNQGGDRLPMKILVGLAFTGGSMILLLPGPRRFCGGEGHWPRAQPRLLSLRSGSSRRKDSIIFHFQ